LLGLPQLLWLPAGFLAVVSFFDDKLDLSPRTPLAGITLVRSAAGSGWRVVAVAASVWLAGGGSVGAAAAGRVVAGDATGAE